MPARVPIQGANVKAGECVVVYSIATGRIRRWLVSDRDGEIKAVDVMEGEAFIRVPPRLAANLHELQDRLFAVTGKRPIGDRYVVVRDGVIENVIIADPTCGDAIDGCELIAHPTADDRWTFDLDTRVFTPPILPPGPVRPR